MIKEKKVIKLNQEEILSILSEYFNSSGNKYISSQVYATNICLLGKIDEDFRLICILSNDEDEEDIFNINFNCIDKCYDFTGNFSVDLINNYKSKK